MTRKLRRKFIATAMLSLLIIVLLLLAALNISNYLQISARADARLERIYQQGGRLTVSDVQGPPDMYGPDRTEGRDTPVSGAFPGAFSLGRTGPGDRFNDMRFFSIWADADGSITDSDLSNTAAVSSSDASRLAQSVYAQTGLPAAGETVSGYIGTYRFLAGLSPDMPDSLLMVFTDCSNELTGAAALLRASALVGLSALAAMFVLVYIFAGRAVAPAVESMARQKQFISDAGHELKTPLAIISADVDVIELTQEKNKWTTAIREQVVRMTGLIEQMLLLARMEDPDITLQMEMLDLSALLEKCTEDLSPVAAGSGRSLDKNIAPGIHVRGNADTLKQLCNILLDNAIRYSDDGSGIRIGLERAGKVRLTVSNRCSSLPEGDPERLFERFYRADPSRSRRTGGSGIGLSSARAVAEAHGGEIHAAVTKPDIICFTVILP